MFAIWLTRQYTAQSFKFCCFFMVYISEIVNAKSDSLRIRQHFDISASDKDFSLTLTNGSNLTDI